jgi:hypothetical protein
MRCATSLILMAGLALAACGATTQSAMPRPPDISNARAGEAAAVAPGHNELPPQTLAAGSCATFFWTADDRHRFVAFENETEGFARIFANGAAHGFYTPPREGRYVAGDPYRRDYVDPQRQLDISISGTIGDPLPQGQRIGRTVMRVLQPSGQTVVVPLIGHYACRSVQNAG